MTLRKLDLINGVTGFLFVSAFFANAFISVFYFDQAKVILFEESNSFFYSEKGDYWWWIGVTSLEWLLLYLYIWGKCIHRSLELFGYFQTGKTQKMVIDNVISFGYRKDEKRYLNDYLLEKLTNPKFFHRFKKVFWTSQIIILPLAFFFLFIHINISNSGIEILSFKHIQPKSYEWHDISEVIIYEKHLQTEMPTDILYYTLFTNDHTSVNLLRYVDSFNEVKEINNKLIENRVPVIFQCYDEEVVYRKGTQLKNSEKQALYQIFLKQTD